MGEICIPRSGRSPRGENGNPLQYSCLENPMGRGAWQATIHGFPMSQTQLTDSHFQTLCVFLVCKDLLLKSKIGGWFFFLLFYFVLGFPSGSAVKNLPVKQTEETLEMQFIPQVGKMPWRRKWEPTPVILPGESYGQRSLAGYSPWGCKESDTTEQLTHTSCDMLFSGKT